jgi:phage regulator Rha-like protein
VNALSFRPLILIVNGEPLASPEVIAEGMAQQHASVIKLARKHQAALERFGLVRFEIRPRRHGSHGGGSVEFAMLNRDQAALLISLMRNTDEVVAFKANLIAEFGRMRDALNARSHNLWQQMQSLIAREVESKVRASFGSQLMLERRREIPGYEQERERLESEIQPGFAFPAPEKMN